MFCNFYFQLAWSYDIFHIDSFFLCVTRLFIWQNKALTFHIFLLSVLGIHNLSLNHEFFIRLSGCMRHKLWEVELNSWFLNFDHRWTFGIDLSRIDVLLQNLLLILQLLVKLNLVAGLNFRIFIS